MKWKQLQNFLDLKHRSTQIIMVVSPTAMFKCKQETSVVQYIFYEDRWPCFKIL